MHATDPGSIPDGIHGLLSSVKSEPKPHKRDREKGREGQGDKDRYRQRKREQEHNVEQRPENL